MRGLMTLVPKQEEGRSRTYQQWVQPQCSASGPCSLCPRAYSAALGGNG